MIRNLKLNLPVMTMQHKLSCIMIVVYTNVLAAAASLSCMYITINHY